MDNNAAVSFSELSRRTTTSSRDESLVTLSDKAEGEFSKQQRAGHESTYASTDDEADEEPLVGRRKLRFVRQRSNESCLNSNSNNNIKYSGGKSSDDNKGGEFKMGNGQLNRRRVKRTRSGTSPYMGLKDGEVRRNPWRNHSVQLTSIRARSSGDNNKKRNWAAKKYVYNQRLIQKNGTTNVHIKTKGMGRLNVFSRFSSDIFTTLLDSSWSWILFITMTVYVGHWIIFGILYWVFAVANNDYEKIFGPTVTVHEASSHPTFSNATATTATSTGSETPCVFEVYDLLSAFLFSMESETTIGYGLRGMTTTCPIAVACLTIQCIVSAIFDTWVIGMCYARLASPSARSRTTLFSQNAVICKRDGKRCLLVRVANLRKSLLLNVSVRAKLINLTGVGANEKHSGYQLMLEQRDLAFQNNATTLLTAPVEYCHIIEKNSPLFGIPSDMYHRSKQNRFEIVFILTGTLESTGMTMHAQTSYLSSEIDYGHRFAPILSKNYAKSQYEVNFKRFHDTVPEPISLRNYDVTNDSTLNGRSVVTSLIEETEEDIISVSDEVFSAV
nr:ATP-sensitive inward rectifier potassium channel 1-like [Ciona intestinalis]XP_018667314.1 ATP-sensitive inward rectifier potassium channel 1-like [Ciona intestinalis]XP_026689855.1 ATP-sensitive inward rectifier potassium channel 1-like [Ciona intestinalis]|eukprot:XP_002126220.3 ATP-sensitive inward rectifier potassium channel 1-like [Ciona intestinalis]